MDEPTQTELPVIFSTRPATQPEDYVGVWPPVPKGPEIKPCVLHGKITTAITNGYLGRFRGPVTLYLDTANVTLEGRCMIPRIYSTLVYLLVIFSQHGEWLIPTVAVMSIVGMIPVFKRTAAIPWNLFTRISIDPKPGRLGLSYESQGKYGLRAKYTMPCDMTDADRDKFVECANILAPTRVVSSRLASPYWVALWWVVIALLIAASAFVGYTYIAAIGAFR